MMDEGKLYMIEVITTRALSIAVATEGRQEFLCTNIVERSITADL